MNAAFNKINELTSAPGLAVPSSSTGSYTASWYAVSNAYSYTLQESANGGGWNTVYNGAGLSVSLSRGVGTYGYRVQGCSAGVCGPWSATKSVSVTHVGTVSGLAATVYRDVEIGDAFLANPWQSAATGAADVPVAQPNAPPPPTKTYVWSVKASWTAASGATRYEAKVDNTITSASTTYGTTTNELLFTSVENSSIKVSARACDAAGCSAWRYAWQVALQREWPGD